MKETVIRPVAYIRTDFKEKFGIPRQSGRAKELVGKIIFYPEFRSPDAIREIEGFSYLWLLFDFSLSHTEQYPLTVRPPRLGGNRRVGVFASRSPFRPNPIGLSSVKLIGIENDPENGNVLIVSGADLLDMTPIYDIKPYIRASDCHPDALSGYSDEFTDHHLNVVFPEDLLAIIPEDKREGLKNCIADDPRPSYHNDPERIYSMKFAEFDIHFTVSENIAIVIAVDRL